MNLPNELFYVLTTVIALSFAMALVGYITKSGRNFRSRRNKRARKQF